VHGEQRAEHQWLTVLCYAPRLPSFERYHSFCFILVAIHVMVYAGKHVVFGKVVKGYEIAKQIAEIPVDEKHRPLSPVVISNCGELELRRPPGKY
jgi:peptidyl-prolyl isomerase G (cyclophilin G)